MSSGTREPAFMWDSASRPRGDCVSYLMMSDRGKGVIPNGVLLRTAFLKRSPELSAESWGNLFMRRSACVPLPTPGAPTSMIRAARLNSFVAIELDKGVRSGERSIASAQAEGEGGLLVAARSSRLQHYVVTASCRRERSMYNCTDRRWKLQRSPELSFGEGVRC